jgi:hypothetical protein
MNLNRHRYLFPVRVVVIVLFAALAFCIPSISAASLDKDQIPGFIDSQTLNVTNASFINQTIPHEYQITPTPIRVEVKYEGTVAGVKGEMALSPRTIGLSMTPGAFVVLVIVVMVGLGIGYFVWQKRNEEDTGK